MLACMRRARASSWWIIFPWVRSCLPWGESHDRAMTLPWWSAVSLLNCTSTTALPFFFVRLFCVTWKKIITGFLSGFWQLMPWKNWKVHILPFSLIASVCLCDVLCPQFSSWEVFGSCLSSAACFEIAFCSLELILIFVFLVNIFNYDIIYSLGDKEALKNCWDSSLWILPGGIEAFLILPQTPLILKRTSTLNRITTKIKIPAFSF